MVEQLKDNLHPVQTETLDIEIETQDELNYFIDK